VTDVLAFLAATVAVTAVLCGHQGRPWPLAGLWRSAWTAAASRKPQEPAGAPERPSRGSRDAGTPQKPADGRTELRPQLAPSWARKDAA